MMCPAGASILPTGMMLTPGGESYSLMARGVVPSGRKMRGKRTAHLVAMGLEKLERVSLSAPAGNG